MRTNSCILNIPDQIKLSEDECILDIQTSGRYWRTGLLEAVSVITGRTQITWYSEEEKDEYEILVKLSDVLRDISQLITFNGHSFDIPWLTKKIAAYGMSDPFAGKHFQDLYLKYRPLSGFLSLSSAKLSSFAEKLYGSTASGCSDACKTALIRSFDTLDGFLNGDFELLDTSGDEVPDAVVYTLKIKTALPETLSLHDEIYHLAFGAGSGCQIAQNSCSGESKWSTEVKLCVHIRNGSIRCYHTDVSNYFYLPLEGYAVHKTMAEYVDKTRKEKAVRENCFHLISYSDSFLNDREFIIRYIRTALRFLRSR